MGFVILISLSIFGALGLFTLIRGIHWVINESIKIRVEAASLISGDRNSSAGGKIPLKRNRPWRSLFFKLNFLILVLLIMVVLLVSSLFYLVMSSGDFNLQRSDDLLGIILPISVGALLLGAAGSIVLSLFFIQPLKRLLMHIEGIRYTENKAKLGKLLFKSKDEFSIIGDTLNTMIRDLIQAADTATDISMGKEIQKSFIPLELHTSGNKLCYGAKDTRHLEFFGYYEGAKGLSGDYFDYKDLDGRYYAIIKCDVAGKGIPAAFIMIQVATMFLNYFKDWQPNPMGFSLENFVYQVNGFIESLGYKGRFAAFSLCLYDSQTGIVRFCNAGDNLIRRFDASQGELKIVNLPETPAAGVLPNYLVKSVAPYTVHTIVLEPEDILLLYTDGIEESRRTFRNSAFEEIICQEGTMNTPHGSHVVGQGDEHMGGERVRDIINAVMNKGTYTLHKWHNPEGDHQDLVFNFSSSQGCLQDMLKALVGVEKMFRCYRDPKATESDRVMIDQTIDSFLKEHLLQYPDYCYNTYEDPEHPGYICCPRLMEDEQYDDLTILGIRRK
ncbi:MAG: SpoIIE family protein phosphatase [Treponema sp.]|nr:SpoIIE family protein phosphatase [Treponema sp.]